MYANDTARAGNVQFICALFFFDKTIFVELAGRQHAEDELGDIVVANDRLEQRREVFVFVFFYKKK